MQNKNFVSSFAAVIVFFLAFVFLLGWVDDGKSIKYIKIGGQTITIELALTPSEIQRGLSYRTGLEENNGMLFVFLKPGDYPFWMKDMNFSIDIIWLDQDRKVIYIKKDAKPESYPNNFSPDVSKGYAQYVLEVPAGFSERNNIKEGDVAEFTY